jgi:16S rRNA (cytidine1402-2'-O)-methyltransferase
MVSLREHNETREAPKLVARLLGGESIALVSDAGTPGIADPGAGLVRAARAAGITVSPIPGASAVAAALSISGFPADEFVFFGFPPRSGTDRVDWFERLTADPRTIVLYEAPHRIERTLAELSSCLAKRPIIVNRELTKINEISVELPINPAEARVRAQGEFVIVVGPQPSQSESPADGREVANLFDILTKNGELNESEVLKLVSLRFGVTENRVKRLAKRVEIERKRRAPEAP